MPDSNLRLTRDELLECLCYLNSIVPSFDRLGSCEAAVGPEQSRLLLSEFVDRWDVARKLARIRRLLSEPLSNDDCETLFEKEPVWSLTNRAPSGGRQLPPSADRTT